MMRIPFVEICCNFVRWHRLSLYLYHLVADRCYDVEQSQFWLYHILTFAWKRKFRSKSINGFYHENMMRQVKMVAVVRISFNTYTHKISMHESKSAPMCIPMSFFSDRNTRRRCNTKQNETKQETCSFQMSKLIFSLHFAVSISVEMLI